MHSSFIPYIEGGLQIFKGIPKHYMLFMKMPMFNANIINARRSTK